MNQRHSVIAFKRTRSRENWFSWPTIVFHFITEAGIDIGQFSIGINKASFLAEDGHNNFLLKRSFWTYRWTYEDGSLFAKISFGLAGKRSMMVADGTRYFMRLTRRWNIFRKPNAEEHAHEATFFREETPVLILRNDRRRRLMEGEAFMLMEGTITTEITDLPLICAMVLLFQSSLTLSAAAGGA